MIRTLLLAAVTAVACRAPTPGDGPFPALPDTIYTTSGATPVLLVDSIGSSDSTRTLVGQYQYLARRVLISRIVLDAKQRRKVFEHERCHIILAETGLALHATSWYTELLCDAFASARVAEIERSGRP